MNDDIEIEAGAMIPNVVRPGRAAFIVSDGRKRLFVVTAARLLSDPFAETGLEAFDAKELIVAHPVNAATGGAHQPISLVRPQNALGQAVFRFTDVAGRAPGRVTALHGALRVAGTKMKVRNVVEVEFLERVERGEATSPVPNLEPSELGSLVLTYEGAGIGLIVGGSGNRALVAPVYDFVGERSLQLLPSEFDPGRKDLSVGLDFMYNELSRARSLDFGDVPTTEAA